MSPPVKDPPKPPSQDPIEPPEPPNEPIRDPEPPPHNDPPSDDPQLTVTRRGVAREYPLLKLRKYRSDLVLVSADVRGGVHRREEQLKRGSATRVESVPRNRESRVERHRQTKDRNGSSASRAPGWFSSDRRQTMSTSCVRAGDDRHHIKASITDHLERILLARLGDVVCWQER